MPRWISSLRRSLPLLVLAAALSCDDFSSPRQSDWYAASIMSPNGAEGSALLEITGEVTEVTSESARVFFRANAGVTRAILVLPEAGTLRFRVRLASVAPPPDTRIVMIGGPSDSLRLNLAGYRVQYRAAP